MNDNKRQAKPEGGPAPVWVGKCDTPRSKHPVFGREDRTPFGEVGFPSSSLVRKSNPNSQGLLSLSSFFPFIFLTQASLGTCIILPLNYAGVTSPKVGGAEAFPASSGPFHGAGHPARETSDEDKITGLTSNVIMTRKN